MIVQQKKQDMNNPNSLTQKINLKIKEMFKKHLIKVDNMNQQKVFGGKNSKHDKSDKIYRDIAQLQAKINEGIFQSLKQDQTLRKQRKDLFQNKLAKFIVVLKETHQKKNIKIKINDNIQKIIVDASRAADQSTSMLKRFQKQGNGWCGRTSDFKVPFQIAFTNLCQYCCLFQNISKFESVTNDSVKQIYLPVQYNEKQFAFIKKQLIELWPEPIIKTVQVIKQKQIIKEEPKVASDISRLDEAHQLYFGFTRPQQPYKAIKIYEEQAKKALPSKASALNALGMIYQTGKYAPKDFNKALKFYKQAQKLNSSEAMHKIGLFLQKGLINSKQQFQGKYPNRQAEIRAAIDYYQKAAKLGHLDAITDLGFIYENGIQNQFGQEVIPQHSQYAIDYYKKAKKQQFPRALNNLGSFLIKNDKYTEGSKGQTLQKGIRYLTRAKQLKYPKAFLNLGKCFENGIGTVQSIDKARACYLQGIEAGQQSCKMEYIRTYLTEKIDDSKVMIKLAQLCREVLLKDQSNPEANYFMGLFCEKGIGTEKNQQSSFYYIQKAARRNHPAALLKLGDYYYSGYYVEKNYDYAKKLYDMANEKGNTQALLNIGLMKEKGLLDERDDINAQKVYEGAARLGNPNGFLYSGLNKGPEYERQALLKAAQMGSIQAVDILKKTQPMWVPKRQKENMITHSEWVKKNTRPKLERAVNSSNISNQPSSRISVSSNNQLIN